MGKALTGAAEIAGAIGMGTLAFFQPELLALPGYAEAMYGLGMAGLSNEAGAIADALSANRGQNITTRQPASFRQVVYGMQRVGGTLIYPSTTGSHKDQYNRVIVLATNQLSAITDLYLDGRRVVWVPGRVGNVTVGGYNFGGDSDGNSHTGPDGTQYNFGDSQVYCEAKFGNQLDGDVIGGLTANDPAWAAGPHGSPWVGGCAYVYLKIEYNQTNFPGDPEIRFTVMGKPVYDPRTGQTAYSSNPALILNDILVDPIYGLNDASVNQAQLIAAANICDEQVWSPGAAANENRYSCHWHYDTSIGVGDILNTVKASMGARLCRIGGEWHIFPAAWIAPTANFGPDNLTGPVQWSSKRASRELFNEVRGTYTAPNFPYNIAGNYYDSNGFANGMIQNNFGFAFQPTNYPAFACDLDHGYPANQYLAQDGGRLLTKELGLPAVLSVSQAQRLAKIELLRNRQQGSGKLLMNLAAFGLQDCDTFNMTFEQEGWSNKTLEVTNTQFMLAAGGTGQPPKIMYTVEVQETDPSVYEWDPDQEQTIYAAPAMSQATYIVAPPTNLQLVSSAGTALVQADGNVIPRIKVTWDTPEDILVREIRIQYRQDGTTAWTDGGSVSVDLNVGYISPIVSGLTYEVQICSVRSGTNTSVWVDSNIAADVVLSVSTGAGIGVGSLAASSYANGSARIICQPFTGQIGTLRPAYFPGGAYTLTADASGVAIAQQKRYWVFVLDPTGAGGDLVPVATLNKDDFLGKVGYWLIDSIVTLFANGTTGGTSSSRFTPSSFSDGGSQTSGNPTAAYDGDLNSCATVGGYAFGSYPQPTSDPNAPVPEPSLSTSYGMGSWSGFSNYLAPAPMTLTVVVAIDVENTANATPGTVAVTATIGGSTITLDSGPPTSTSATFTAPIPSSTNLSSITVSATCTPGTVPSDSTNRVESSSAIAQVYEIYAN